MKSLLKYNHLESTQRLQPGRILWLREKRPNNVPAEYQVLPEPVPEPEPTVAERKLTRESEESLVDSPSSGSATGSSADSTGGSPATPPALYYTVKEGDTHSGVAQRYNLPLSDLMNWNNLSYRKPLVAGQRLIVGKPTAPAATEAPRPAPNQPVLTGPVTATASALPRSTTATATTVKAAAPAPARRTRDTAAVVGVNRPAKVPGAIPVRPRPQRIINQVRIETPKVNGSSYYHVVQRGQTVYRVALINKVAVQDVMRWNNLTNYTIEIGQRILIKK
jgi:membrane-bound lytic murein transglycosylase D